MAAQGFILRRSLDGNAESPVVLERIVKNSATIRTNDAITIDQNGFARRVAATEPIAGIAQGVVDKNGGTIDGDAASTPDTYTVASDNQTVAMKRVRYIPALPQYLFKATASSALTANTDLFAYCDLTDHDTVNQGGLTHTATAQVRIIEIDPDGESDATQVLVQIVESQFAQTNLTQVA